MVQNIEKADPVKESAPMAAPMAAPPSPKKLSFTQVDQGQEEETLPLSPRSPAGRTNSAEGTPQVQGRNNSSGAPSSKRASRFSRTSDYVAFLQSGKVVPPPPEEFDCLRKKAYWLLRSNFPGSDSNIFDSVIGLVVLFNIVLMVVETDQSSDCVIVPCSQAMIDAGTCPPPRDPEAPCVKLWVTVCNYVLLGIYTLEVCIRLYVEHLKFFRGAWNLLDFFIVFAGVVSSLLSDLMGDLSRVSILRLVRIGRVIRVAKILKRFPTLMNMIGGFVGAMQAMIWGFVLIVVLLIIWSIMAVELIYPKVENLVLKGQMEPDEYCALAFSTVMRSTLTFFQTLVAGDSWGACSIPFIEEDPFTYIIFACALVTVQLGFTNLVLAVIVDKANEAREASKEEQKIERAKAEAESISRWREVMRELDTDQSGSISLDELMAGYKEPSIRETLDQMNINKADLKDLFLLMDNDGSGSLDYDEFVDCFHKAQTQDSRMYLMTLQLRIQKLEYKFNCDLDLKFNELKNILLQAVGNMQGQGSGGYRPMRTFRTDSTHMRPPPRLLGSIGAEDAVPEEVEGENDSDRVTTRHPTVRPGRHCHNPDGQQAAPAGLPPAPAPMSRWGARMPEVTQVVDSVFAGDGGRRAAVARALAAGQAVDEGRENIVEA